MAGVAERKVVFVHTPCPELDDDRLEPPLGILYLATLLKQKGIPCQICDLSGIPKDQWFNHLVEGSIYAFSTYSVNYHRTLRIRDLVREKFNPNAITIAGGPHVSALPQKCSQDFDIIIIREAENTFLQIIERLQTEQVRGVFIGESISDLDQLPHLDYDLVDLSSYHRIVEGSPSLSMITSRGCPYRCAFCNSRVFTRGELRFRSPENVALEITVLIKKYGTTTFRFSDDLFTFSPQRIAEMTNAIRPLSIFYRVFARSNSLTEKAAGQLYESGCRHLAIGIESMSAKMLQLFNKQVTPEINRQALVNAKRAGFKVRIYLLIGFPGETERTIHESLDRILECDFDEFIVYPFIPYPGTAVWENPEKWGAKIDRDFSKYVQVGRNRSTCFAVRTSDFTPDDVRRWRDLMISELEKKVCWAGKSSDNR